MNMCCGTFKSLKRLPYWSNYYNTSLAVIILSEERIFNLSLPFEYCLKSCTFLENNVISDERILTILVPSLEKATIQDSILHVKKMRK